MAATRAPDRGVVGSATHVSDTGISRARLRLEGRFRPRLREARREITGAFAAVLDAELVSTRGREGTRARGRRAGDRSRFQGPRCGSFTPASSSVELARRARSSRSSRLGGSCRCLRHDPSTILVDLDVALAERSHNRKRADASGSRATLTEQMQQRCSVAGDHDRRFASARDIHTTPEAARVITQRGRGGRQCRQSQSTARRPDQPDPRSDVILALNCRRDWD